MIWKYGSESVVRKLKMGEYLGSDSGAKKKFAAPPLLTKLKFHKFRAA